MILDWKQMFEAVCHGCNKKGHIVKTCRASSKPHFEEKTRSLHWTGENSETDSDGEVIISTLQVNSVCPSSEISFSQSLPNNACHGHPFLQRRVVNYRMISHDTVHLH
jgi:hypothetical protein